MNVLYRDIYDLAMMQLLSFKRISCVGTTSKMTCVEYTEYPSSTNGRQIDCPLEDRKQRGGFR